MSNPSPFIFQYLGRQAQMMSKETGDERMAMILRYAGIGCMIIMTSIAANQLTEMFTSPNHRGGSGRSR